MVGSRVYIGNLPKDTGDRDLERFFRGFGPIRDVLIKNGYGFVELDDPRDADDAVYELNGKRLLGERVTVERARGTPRGRDQWTGRDTRNRNNFGGNNERYGPPTRTDHRLIVENLSSRVSWQDLKDYMRQAGEVTYADAHKYRNEGVVEFASSSDMKNALEKLDDTEINGRKIHLVEDKRRDKKSLSYSSRSRSRSRSRRRSRSASASRSHSRSRSHRSSSRSKNKSGRARDSKSKSRSVSRDKTANKNKSKSRSRSRSRSAASKHSARRTRSRSASKEPEKSKPHSRSRSQSPEK